MFIVFFGFDLRRPGLWLIEVSGLVPQLLMDAPSRPGLLHSEPDLLLWILGPRFVWGGPFLCRCLQCCQRGLAQGPLFARHLLCVGSTQLTSGQLN